MRTGGVMRMNGQGDWRLLTAAHAAIRRKWPIVPGTYLDSDYTWRGRDDTTKLCPIDDAWRTRPVTDEEEANEIWGQTPYGVLLVCGHIIVLDLPEDMRPLLEAFQTAGPLVPVAHGGNPRRFLMLATGSTELDSDLAHAGVRVHAEGTWVALPPTCLDVAMEQRWWTAPAPNEARLRPAGDLHTILLASWRRSGLGIRGA